MSSQKYYSIGILPQADVPMKFGKKMFVENKGIYLDLNNAGVNGERISELNINSRKQISNKKTDSTQIKEALNHSEKLNLVIQPKKRALVTYSSYDNQNKYFETKLVPDNKGKMSICVGRKSGSATVNMSIDEYDLEKTYSTWKRIVEKSKPHTRSNLENDRFLTVSEDSKRSDREPVIKNRNPPEPNKDGPFETERSYLPRQARDNLDRTLTPREKSKKADNLRKTFNIYKDTFHLSRPHQTNDPVIIKGVKRSNASWACSDRLKKIIFNYDDYENRNNFKDKTVPHQITTNNINYGLQDNNIDNIDNTAYSNKNRDLNENYIENNSSNEEKNVIDYPYETSNDFSSLNNNNNYNNLNNKNIENYNIINNNGNISEYNDQYVNKSVYESPSKYAKEYYCSNNQCNHC